MRWVRCLIAAVLAELAAIVVLVLVVAVLAPRDPAAAQAYAEGLGRFVGPIAGALFGILGGYFVARPLRAAHLRHGAFFGILFALIDLVLLAVSQAPFESLFVVSNVGRVIGGILGARLASGHPAAT
jgi:hypothetical protein